MEEKQKDFVINNQNFENVYKKYIKNDKKEEIKKEIKKEEFFL